jgi:eukaryotic-like serine/threonine-protein kinase
MVSILNQREIQSVTRLMTRSVPNSVPTCRTSALDGQVLLDRFEIRGLLGEGAMGHVYLANDRRYNLLVAFKILKQDRANSPQECSRFVLEARAALRIDHPCVLKTFEAGILDSGQPYLVSELLIGESLGEYLRRERRLNLTMGLELFLQASRAFDAAHRAGVIHRDIKPDNIFLEGPIGTPQHLKILDFGLAKLHFSQEITDHGVAVGTVDYIPPEQFLTDPVDRRSDIYSLGMVMFKALTGQPAFVAKTAPDVMAHHLLSPPPFPSSLASGLPLRLDAIILTTLRKSPDLRYQNMRLLADDLERVIHQSQEPLTGTLYPFGMDEYIPQNELAKQAAKYCFRKFGIPLPDWAA